MSERVEDGRKSEVRRDSAVSRRSRRASAFSSTGVEPEGNADVPDEFLRKLSRRGSAFGVPQKRKSTFVGWIHMQPPPFSTGSAFAFAVLNIAFGAYCVLGIPEILKRPAAFKRRLVGVLAAYLSCLGVSQLVEMLSTGQGTNYGKFGGAGEGEDKRSRYQKMMDRLAVPTVPISISWWTMEQPSFIVPLVFLLRSVVFNKRKVDSGAVFLAMFMIHYTQRSFIYPWLSRGRPYPTLYWALALVFTSVNGTLQSLDLLHSGRYQGMKEARSIRAMIGYSIFAFGMHTNISCDNILRNLRKPGELGYKIPRGGMFTYISGANLWGECVEWLGLAIASGGFGPAVFSAFCWIGIGGRACATHDWYMKKFGEEYELEGRAKIIPFIW